MFLREFPNASLPVPTTADTARVHWDVITSYPWLYIAPLPPVRSAWDDETYLCCISIRGSTG